MEDTMEQFYKVITKSGHEDYYYAPTAQAAILEAEQDYGKGIAVRIATYGEADCGGTCQAHRNFFNNSKKLLGSNDI